MNPLPVPHHAASPPSTHLVLIESKNGKLRPCIFKALSNHLYICAWADRGNGVDLKPFREQEFDARFREAWCDDYDERVAGLDFAERVSKKHNARQV